MLHVYVIPLFFWAVLLVQGLMSCQIFYFSLKRLIYGDFIASPLGLILVVDSFTEMYHILLKCVSFGLHDCYD